MKIREQLLKALANFKYGQEDIVTLKVIESCFKDELKKKNNEAKNLRARMLDAQMANKIVIEKYKKLTNYLGLDHSEEELERALEAINKTQNGDLLLQKKLERLSTTLKEQKNIAPTQLLKERRNYAEFEKAVIIVKLNEAKVAYTKALLDLVTSVTQENDDSRFYENDKNTNVAIKDDISAWLQLIHANNKS
jgi:hypothetical protein